MQPTGKRAALYARVSTNNGHQDPAMQLRELREYCDRRGLKITDEYVDNGVSGAKERRPHLDPSACRLPAPVGGCGYGVPL